MFCLSVSFYLFRTRCHQSHPKSEFWQVQSSCCSYRPAATIVQEQRYGHFIQGSVEMYEHLLNNVFRSCTLQLMSTDRSRQRKNRYGIVQYTNYLWSSVKVHRYKSFVSNVAKVWHNMLLEEVFNIQVTRTSNYFHKFGASFPTNTSPKH